MCKGNVYDNWRFMRQMLEPWAFDISRIYLPEIEPWATETESERPFGMYGDQIRRRYLPTDVSPKISSTHVWRERVSQQCQNEQSTSSTEVESPMRMQIRRPFMHRIKWLLLGMRIL